MGSPSVTPHSGPRPAQGVAVGRPVHDRQNDDGRRTDIAWLLQGKDLTETERESIRGALADLEKNNGVQFVKTLNDLHHSRDWAAANWNRQLLGIGTDLSGGRVVETELIRQLYTGKGCVVDLAGAMGGSAISLVRNQVVPATKMVVVEQAETYRSQAAWELNEAGYNGVTVLGSEAINLVNNKDVAGQAEIVMLTGNSAESMKNPNDRFRVIESGYQIGMPQLGKIVVDGRDLLQAAPGVASVLYPGPKGSAIRAFTHPKLSFTIYYVEFEGKDGAKLPINPINWRRDERPLGTKDCLPQMLYDAGYTNVFALSNYTGKRYPIPPPRAGQYAGAGVDIPRCEVIVFVGDKAGARIPSRRVETSESLGQVVSLQPGLTWKDPIFADLFVKK